MKKATKQITVTELTLNEEELKCISQCLKYAYHRLTKHPECGISGIIKKGTLETLKNFV